MLCFDGIRFSTFLSTHDEWHSFVLGYCETAWPVPAKYDKLSEDLRDLLREERWYYVFGRVLGGISLVLFAVGIYHML